MASGSPTDDELRARPNIRRCSIQNYLQVSGTSIDNLSRYVGLSAALLELWLDNGETLSLRQSTFVDRFIERKKIAPPSKDEIAAMLAEDTERKNPKRELAAPDPPPPAPSPVVRAASRRANKRTEEVEVPVYVPARIPVVPDIYPLVLTEDEARILGIHTPPINIPTATNGKNAVVDFEALVEEKSIEIAKRYEDNILSGLPLELAGFERVTAVNYWERPLELNVRPSGAVALNERLFTEMGKPRFVRAWWCAETKAFALEALDTNPTDPKDVVYQISPSRYTMASSLATSVKAPTGRYSAKHINGKFWLCRHDLTAQEQDAAEEAAT